MLEALYLSIAIFSGASFATDQAATMGYLVGRAKACKVDRSLVRQYEEQADLEITDMAIDDEDLHAARMAYKEGVHAGRTADDETVEPLFDCSSVELQF